ncbi:MAG: polymerase sigma-54 factor [Pseudomonadota bacterium]|nr:polymerase sigma-54 factor [Pseudomonadota bacterium]
MTMKPALQLRISQQLTMTPQLQQAIRLLLMPVTELNTQLEQLLADNMMLEAEEPAVDAVDLAEPMPVMNTDGANDGADAESETWDARDEPAEAAPEPSGNEEMDSLLWNETSGGGAGFDDEDGRPEPSDRSSETLHAHLMWQLETEHFSAREFVIGEALIDAIDDAGYLGEPLAAILAMLDPAAGYTLAEIEQTLAKIQALDPAGIGARDLGECLRLQLRQLAADVPGRELALAITQDGLDLVAEQQYAMLRRRLSVSAEELDAALALIRHCNPKPGLAIHPAPADYIVPDVYVRKRQGRWQVDLNRSVTPRLKVNQEYANLVRGDSAHTVLRNQLQEARWLVRSLEIRDDTLLKVATCIVERQAEFLDRGDEAMRPMVLKDVAELVGMHESTISRVTTNKYMYTPRGVFEFRHFFSSQVTGDDGSEQSSTAIRARIRRLIGQEDPASPLSDSQLATMLAKENIKVARRTVAKYREAMQIEPSSERKRRRRLTANS